MPELPHDIDDIRLAPVALHVEDRLSELSRLSPEEMRLRVALDTNSGGSDREHRSAAMLATIARDLPLGAWEIDWHERGLLLQHGVHQLVLGVPRSVTSYVEGKTVTGRPNR